VTLDYDIEAVRRFCRERGVSRLELFGSALRGELRAESDVDLLCTVRPGVKCGLLEWVAMKLELERIFNRQVDLVSRRAIERSRNPYRRESLLAHTLPLYVEG
jgi:uncharacterized protein